MKVKRNTLLLLACLVWSAAGVNILRIGLITYPPYLSIVNFFLSALTFAVFQRFIFGRLVKNTRPESPPTRRSDTFFSSSLMENHLPSWR